MPQTIIDKSVIYGDKYDSDDTWYIDALVEISTRNSPQFTVLHDLKTHAPFYRNEDGLRAPVSGNEALVDPDNYPPQHRYTAKIVLAYIAVILERDPDAVIVIEADHGLHHEKNREQLLAKKRTPAFNDEDARIMQNQVMSAVRIPKKWGGLDKPLDPLNISRVLANRYAGRNYPLLESHP
jgi:hypothetical protein